MNPPAHHFDAPRPALKDLAEPAFALERLVFSVPWTLGMIEDSLARPETIAFCTGPATDLTGIVFLRVAADEAEILRLAVHPDHRRKGVGSILLKEGLLSARDRGAARVFLEVREGNKAAIGFYRALFFKVVGQRPRYYTDTGEAAFVMAKSI